MKEKIHPEYVESIIHCACGYVMRTRSTRKDMHVGICSHCHPFFTGTQKYVDTAGRVERFKKRYAKMAPKAPEVPKAPAPKTPAPKAPVPKAP